jgi:hypothetical protein
MGLQHSVILQPLARVRPHTDHIDHIPDVKNSAIPHKIYQSASIGSNLSYLGSTRPLPRFVGVGETTLCNMDSAGSPAQLERKEAVHNAGAPPIFLGYTFLWWANGRMSCYQMRQAAGTHTQTLSLIVMQLGRNCYR